MGLMPADVIDWWDPDKIIIEKTKRIFRKINYRIHQVSTKVVKWMGLICY